VTRGRADALSLRPARRVDFRCCGRPVHPNTLDIRRERGVAQCCIAHDRAGPSVYGMLVAAAAAPRADYPCVDVVGRETAVHSAGE
jgi:hypothetical protein